MQISGSIHYSKVLRFDGIGAFFNLLKRCAWHSKFRGSPDGHRP